MSNICKNAISFLQKRFPIAPVLNGEGKITDIKTGEIIHTYWPMIAQDSHSGVKQRAIAIENLGEKDELHTIAKNMSDIFNELDSGVQMEMGSSKPSGHTINSSQMTNAPRVILYTNKLCAPIQDVIDIFSHHGELIDVVDESIINKTLFICYGGTDEESAGKLNKLIKAKGIKTWFFPDDAPPGEKLHRVMHDGVNNYDRVLLVCSKNSLGRNGVLNEIERALEREAKEGGENILLPVTLDDYVYDEWVPPRRDLAEQVRSRVITKLSISENNEKELEKQVDKIVGVLKK